MINIITSGCSYTVGWRCQFEQILNKPVYRHMPTGNSACGNDIITRGAMHRMIQARKLYPSEKIICIVMFSGLHRNEIRIEKDHPLYDDIVKNSDHEYFLGMNPSEFNHTDTQNLPQWKPKNVWYKSGGFGGQGNASMAGRKLWETYYKTIHSKEERYVKLLENILLLQGTAKKLDIEIVFTTWQNVFFETDLEDTNFENAIAMKYIPKRTKALWDVYPEHNYLWWNIEKDNWCFIDNEYNSLGEYHILNGFVSPDDGHPSTECYQKWCKEILIPHMQDRNLI